MLKERRKDKDKIQRNKYEGRRNKRQVKRKKGQG